MTTVSYSDEFSDVHNSFVVSVFGDFPTDSVSQNVVLFRPEIAVSLAESFFFLNLFIKIDNFNTSVFGGP
jgi:hypothetical protein